MKFSELVRLLEPNGFRIIKEKGSIRYYGCQVWTGSSESIIMVRKKYRWEPATLFLRLPA
ncbi:MAG: hypothetical protein ACE10H_09510 [Candidatus Binatia bacterium]